MRSGWFQSSTVLRRLSLADHGHGHGRTLLTSYSIPSYTGPAALRESLPTKQGVASGLEHQHQGAHISGSGGAGSKLHFKLELQEWPSKLSTLDRNEWAQEQRWRGWTLCISGGQQEQCYEMQINISSTSSAHFPFLCGIRKKKRARKSGECKVIIKTCAYRIDMTVQFDQFCSDCPAGKIKEYLVHIKCKHVNSKAFFLDTVWVCRV